MRCPSAPPPPMAMNANLHLEGWQQVVTARATPIASAIASAAMQVCRRHR